MNSRIIIISSVFLSIFSCRTTPENEKVDNTEKISLINVIPTGVEWEISPISVNPDQQGVSAWGGVII